MGVFILVKHLAEGVDTGVIVKQVVRVGDDGNYRQTVVVIDHIPDKICGGDCPAVFSRGALCTGTDDRSLVHVLILWQEDFVLVIVIRDKLGVYCRKNIFVALAVGYLYWFFIFLPGVGGLGVCAVSGIVNGLALCGRKLQDELFVIAAALL